MSLFRPVALLPLAVTAGCYRDASPPSTLPPMQPQPQYVSGPPGGGMDPGYGYAPGYPALGPSATDPAPAPSEMTPREAAPGPAAPPPDAASAALDPDDEDAPDIAETPANPEAPADPTAGVTDAEIDAALGGYGQWVDTDDYGQVWRPDATVVGVDFTPYESGGSWEYTDAGWAFACDYPWGWLPFHYGRWAWFHDYWGWVPGYRWAPAWVDWRHGGGFVGWRPMAPQIRDHRHSDVRHGSGPLVRDHRHAEQHDSSWRFATVSDFGRPHIRSHLYGNPAEGLRVTSTVAAPPVRGTTSVSARALMRSRFAAGQPGGGFHGAPQVRDHRSPEPRAFQPPAQGARPPRVQSFTAPEAYRSPGRVQPSNPPARTYQPPARGYAPPARAYQPPVRGYAPPARTYQPPARTFTPSAPPSRSFGPPPSSHSGGSSSHSSGSSSHSSGSSSHSSGGGSSSHSGGGHHR